MAKKRFVGNFPKIGIRPVIDGRRGPLKVRESLEDQTMNMAKSAADLISSNLKYINGEPVEVVISETTIGRVQEAARCAEQFKDAGVDITLTVTPCWCYGAETMDMDPMTIKGIWGFNGTERPGAVYLAATLAAHAQKGLPAFGIYGEDVKDADDTEIPEDVAEKILRFAKAAVAAATMRGKSYLQIGGTCMGIAGSMMDYDFFEDYLGMRVESIDEVEIIRRMEEKIYDEEEFERAMEWVKENITEGFDKNPEELQKSREQKDADWEFSVKMMMIIRDLMQGNDNLGEGLEEEAVGHNALIAGFQGQRQWTDFYPNGDFAESMLNSSFDWNGIRAPYIVATENDTLNGAGMAMLQLLTNRAQVFADVRSCWNTESTKRVTGYDLEGHAKEADGFIHLINSGAHTLDSTGTMKDEDGNPCMKPFWEITEEDVQSCLEATTFNPADNGYFRGGGYSSRFETRAEMPMTMMRLNIIKGVGPVIQLVEGWSVELPEEVSDTIWKRTDYTWPSLWFTPRVSDKAPFTSAYDVMNNWGANHGVISYGHVGADLITLASILRIPICMHNIPEEDIYRPAAWNAFGMDKEGQDYRACETYGPLYRAMR